MTSFKYLEATLCKDLCSAEIHIRIAPTMAAMARFNKIWRCNTISFVNKFKLYKSLVTTVLLYGCETWTLLADSEKRTQAFETKSLRKLFHISYLEHKTNAWVRGNINFFVGPQESLLANCRETEICMVWACHTPRQPLQHHPSGHLEGRATPWSAEEMLDGHHRRMDIPCPCQNCSQGLPVEKTGTGSLLNRHSCQPDDLIGQGTELN